MARALGFGECLGEYRVLLVHRFDPVQEVPACRGQNLRCVGRVPGIPAHDQRNIRAD